MGLNAAVPDVENDQIEVSVFGPGFGECAAIHIGDHRWIVVDSCISPATNRPIAFEYLNRIENGHTVDLIVATHWHDDHIRGMSDLSKAYPSAELCISAVLSHKDILATFEAYNVRPMTRISTGSAELISILRNRDQVKRASADRRLYYTSGSNFSHGQDVEVWSLSPSDHSQRRFIESIGRVEDLSGASKRRIPKICPNECSVVILIKVGGISILLGADLEEVSPCRGWSAILTSSGRPEFKAGFFKVPHHGAESGHHSSVWDELLTSHPIYAIAPFNKGGKLPSESDLTRFSALPGRGFITADVRRQVKIKRSPEVDKLIKDSGVKVTAAHRSIGHIRARSIDINVNNFNVELFNSASELTGKQ